MILDGVVSSAIQVFGNLGPSIPQQPVGQEQHPLLMITPFLLLDIRIKMVMPSLPALLANSS